MKYLRIAGVLLVVLLVIGVLMAPIGPVPGFFIGGTTATAPATWPDTSSVHEIRLKVPGILPRTVIIWVVDYKGDLHVVGSRDSGWVSRIGAGSPVELRLGDSTYALRAVPVDAEYDSVLEAYIAKYKADYPDIIAGFPAIADARDSVGVFRLER